MSFLAVTTCNGEQWTQYGRAMATTFCRHWPEVRLRVYAEGFATEQNGRVEFVDLDSAAPWLAPWKESCGPSARGITPEGYRFRWDCVKFAHKIAAIGAAADEFDEGVLIWMDADIVTHSPVSMTWLEGLFPEPADIAWLDRIGVYPECGFMMFRLPSALQVIRDLVFVYRGGQVFEFAETHDSFVIQRIVNSAVASGEIIVCSLSGEGRRHHHVLANSPLGTRLDHLKGKRKAMGRTPKHERRVAGGGAYWS